MADIETVDIEDGDRFMFYWDGLIQKRGVRWRSITQGSVRPWNTNDMGANSCPCSTELARATIRGWGHKTMHTVHIAKPPAPPTTPQPSYPVVRVAELTHAATCCGALTAIGTLEQCLEYTDDDGFIVRLDWTGVGGFTIPAEQLPATVSNYATKPDFKVGDVVRGRVVGNRWQVKYKDGCEPDLYSNEASARNAARTGTGGTVTRVALVEVEAQ